MKMSVIGKLKYWTVIKKENSRKTNEFIFKQKPFFLPKTGTNQLSSVTNLKMVLDTFEAELSDVDVAQKEGLGGVHTGGFGGHEVSDLAVIAYDQQSPLLQVRGELQLSHCTWHYYVAYG